jgi:hypothetical protein
MPLCRVPYTEDDMVKKADAQKAASEKAKGEVECRKRGVGVPEDSGYVGRY